jgi:hypothetical protein
MFRYNKGDTSTLTGWSSNRTRELPGNYPFSVQKGYMEASIKPWREQTESMLERIFRHISRVLKALVFEHFESLWGFGIKIIWKLHSKGPSTFLRVSQLAFMQGYRQAPHRIAAGYCANNPLAFLLRERNCSLVFNSSEYSYYVDTYKRHCRSQYPGFAVRHSGHATGVIPVVIDIASDTCMPATGHNLTSVVDKMETEVALPVDEECGIDIMAKTRAFYHSR